MFETTNNDVWTSLDVPKNGPSPNPSMHFPAIDRVPMEDVSAADPPTELEICHTTEMVKT